MIHKLLSRDEFRNSVFERDGHICVLCDFPAVDAHHIMERRLFPDGGYYLDNGASVCPNCHLMCETTDISVEFLRISCRISKPVLPPHLYDDQVYDKWGNPILPNGRRMKGELFHDESVQKVLSKHLHLFTDWVKYPRTHHLPWSGNINEDDRVIDSLDYFSGRQIVVTTKMDGENTSLYNDYIHARSLDSRHHPSRSWVKNFWNTIKSDIPAGWRICGENLYAKHSIHYDNLLSYFMGFSIWDNRNICLSWEETLEWFSLLGIIPVPVIYQGIYDETFLKTLAKQNWESSEGYVVRVEDQFPMSHFKNSVVKFVRPGHLQTTKHWMYGQPVEKNGMSQ